MASTSIQNSPSSPWNWTYDVFLSFRGEDTRNNFVDHLYAALHKRAVITIKDDTKLKKGKVISQELFKAIEESHICIVVFSKDYAGSTWCVEELAKIVDCNEQVDRNQTILPVFYGVDPSEVRKQTGSYGEAFARHEQTFGDSDKVQRWRKALSKVGNLSGWDARNKSEAQLIEDIIKETINVLGDKFSSLTDEFVGIQSHLDMLNMHFALGLNDIRFIGILGMGGIGKTTLARILYHGTCRYFEGFTFLNVNKSSKEDDLIILQKKLLCDILHEENITIQSDFIGTNLIRTKLRNIKSLIVLDNVEQLHQLEKLAGKSEWFGTGSRIIITTRDEHILKHGVDHVYHVPLLGQGEDVQLFCRKAFKCDYPLKEYEGLVHRVLKYVKGLPLAIQVLGSFLLGRSVLEWESFLARLQDIPPKGIIDVLHTSFDGLEEIEKEMFLDIACCFRGAAVSFIREVFDSCGFHPHIGMRILSEKSLISYVEGNVDMHDLLQDLGRKIVTEKSLNEPGKWSRLWSCKHLHHIIRTNSPSEDIEVIYLPRSYSKEMTLKAEILSKMSRLRCLVIENGLKISGNLMGLSNEIRWLQWENYPDAYLPHPLTPSPSIVQLDNLVELTCSSSKELWESIKPLENLKILSLNYSKNLIKTPDFTIMPNLKRLFLEGCTSLTHVDESIGVLSKLECLYLTSCTSLISLPNSIFCLTSLSDLNLTRCSKLENPFEKTTGVVFLTSLFLGFCNLRELPDAIERMQSLKGLVLSGNNFVTLPSTIKNLSRLVYLNLGECKELQYLPELPLSTGRDFVGKIPFGGLYIYNCPKLVEDETQPYTKLAISWLTKLIRVPHDTEARFHIVIPGNDVPKWFNHQSIGRSTRAQMPYSSEWIGVALCVAFVPTGPGIHSDIGYVVRLRGTQQKINITPNQFFRYSPCKSVESDHLWLLYLPREKSICKILKTWEARKEVEFTAEGKNIEVTQLGIRWVSGQDILDSQATHEDDSANYTVLEICEDEAEIQKFKANSDFYQDLTSQNLSICNTSSSQQPMPQNDTVSLTSEHITNLSTLEDFTLVKRIRDDDDEDCTPISKVLSPQFSTKKLKKSIKIEPPN